jgi:hypothetical protein
MGGHEARSYWEHVGLMMLVASVLLAPAAWLLDVQISYATVKWACEHKTRVLLLAFPAGSLALVALSGWMAWSSWNTLRSVASGEGGRMEDRSYFLALAGLGLSAVFALLILTSVLPRVLLNPCE